MLDLSELKKRTVQDLRTMADELGVERTSGLKKHDLCLKILVAQSEQNGNRYGYGVLEIVQDGRGFLRVDERKQVPLTDIYVADTICGKMKHGYYLTTQTQEITADMMETIQVAPEALAGVYEELPEQVEEAEMVLAEA